MVTRCDHIQSVVAEYISGGLSQVLYSCRLYLLYFTAVISRFDVCFDLKF